ncbi:MAG TPA: hypothetical protein VEB66_13160 [Opitutaceae bacterium]|nr:hypothetical protein [Opitutaceae bacterium]
MHPLAEPNPASAAARALKDPENRSIEIGLGCTLVFHLLLAFVAPHFPVDLIHGSVDAAVVPAGHDFNIELAPDVAPPAPKTDPFRFVETNPDAPENEPDQTANFSNRNQQAAQPEAAKERSPDDMPSVKGQDLIKNETAIVSGERVEPRPRETVVVSTRPADAQAAQAARAEQVPLSGTEKFSGETPENIGSNVSDSKAPTTNAEEYVEGVRDAESRAGATAGSEAQTAPRVPAQRPRLSQARQTILSNRTTGSDRIGVLAAPAFRTEYGEYLDEFIEIVDTRWRNIVAARGAFPPTPSHVTITFNLSAAGEITIVSVEETSGRPGALSATSAIQDGQPYRKWSEKMTAVLGQEQQLVFSFHY